MYYKFYNHYFQSMSKWHIFLEITLGRLNPRKALKEEPLRIADERFLQSRGPSKM